MDILKLKHILQEAKQSNKEIIRDYKEAKKYYHADQIPDDVKQTLISRGQPVIFENMFAMIVDKILGYKAVTRTDVEVVGRQKQDRQVALILTDIIKSITDTSSYTRMKDKSDLELLLGISIVEVWIEKLEQTDKNNKHLKK